MKYDPTYHGSVVRNLKYGYQSRYNAELTLTDEQIWKVFEDCHGIQSDDDDDRDLPIYEGLKEQMDDDGNPDNLLTPGDLDVT